MIRNAIRQSVYVAAITASASVVSASIVTFDWATVGNVGNPADPSNSDAVPGIGSVSYEYRIATTEVTNAQYVEFLNSVDAAGTNPNAIYNNMMSSDARGGISFSAGAASGSKYAVKANMGNKPVNLVSYFDSMRFVNWLENGQIAGGTESGVYTISDGIAETRASGAQFFIPSENEWYKAAYHEPAAQGGDSDNYWTFATGSNTLPIVASATATGDIANPGANVANYAFGAFWNSRVGNVTTVGSAGPLSTSFYGTFDQSGNVFEWNEGLVTVDPEKIGANTRGDVTGTFRVFRGGSWDYDLTGNSLRSSFRSYTVPLDEDVNGGFRVASSVPEPCSLMMLAFLAPALLRRRKGRGNS
jgi:formylglycine-generating enzyme required for sulfatase activity